MLTLDKFEIVYINLKQDVLKNAAMAVRLDEWGFPYKRIDALKFDDPADEFVINNTDMNFKDRTNRNITLGEFGCFMSHVKAWEYAIETDQTILVLEDDVRSSRCVPDTVREITWVHSVLTSSEYEFCYLGRQLMEPHKEDFVEVFRGLVKPRWSWLAHAYMITPDGARKMIEYFMNHLVIPVDEAIPYVIGRGCDPYVWREYPELPEEQRLKALAHVDHNLLYQNRVEDSRTETSAEIRSHGIDPSRMNVVMVTCATDEDNPGFQQLLTSVVDYDWDLDQSYNIGHGVEWNGGDMVAPGGGQKINLLKKEFEDGLFDDEDIIIFMDGYDTAVMDHPYNIVRRWLDNFNPDAVLFAAERTCWPDERLKFEFGDPGTPYKYLNSGCFIGKAKNIRKLIEAEPIENHHDDQLYYQHRFFEIPKPYERDDYACELDTECRIFQCLHKSEGDMEYDPVSNRLYNVITNTQPQIIHGNGHSKETLDILMSHVRDYFRPKWYAKTI